MNQGNRKVYIAGKLPGLLQQRRGNADTKSIISLGSLDAFNNIRQTAILDVFRI